MSLSLTAFLVHFQAPMDNNQIKKMTGELFSVFFLYDKLFFTPIVFLYESDIRHFYGVLLKKKLN